MPAATVVVFFLLAAGYTVPEWDCQRETVYLVRCASLSTGIYFIFYLKPVIW
jgi:hypothetical protein